jgi:peptidoglycan/LPS O-acetylase OafA/YrhL
MKINYRPEIDGLRAIAVFSVIFYHAQLTLFDYKIFEGGFIGVDIFFVISGYLISKLILKELEATGKFSFRYFYERRARRILPALILVIMVSLPLGWVYLLPGSFIEFIKSILYSLGFTSNFYFHFSGLQYGTEDGLLKPLLHTWSLSVEEQFYIFFPIILIVIYNFFRKYLLTLLLLGFVSSLLIAEWSSRNYPSASFYFLHTRIWELIAGSLLAYFEISGKRLTNSYRLNFILPFIGILLIGYSVIFFNDRIFHPSFYTVLPVLGACLIIWFSNKDEIITKILSTKIFVGIGLISYSMYLWHYPIFAFARMKSNAVSQYDKFEWIILTILLSIISYFFIEKFFRNQTTNFLKILSIFLLTIIIFFSSIFIIYKSKHSFKITNIIKKNISEKGFFLRNDHYKFRKAYSPSNFMNTPTKTKKVLVIGNSAAEDLFKIFYLNKELFNEYNFDLISPKIRDRNSVYQLSCLKELIIEDVTRCKGYEFTENILEQFTKSEIIILSTLWTEEDILSLENLIPLIKSKNKKVILVSQQMYMKIYTSYKFNPLDHYVHINKKFPNKEDLEKIEKDVYNDLDKILNQRLLDISKQLSVPYLNIEEIQCNRNDELCKLITPEGYKIYWDAIHITEEGAKYLGKKIKQLNWFNNN